METEKRPVQQATNATIDGVTYRVNVWPVTKSMRYLHRLLDVSGEHILPFIEGKYEFADVLRFTRFTNDSDMKELVQEAVCSSYREGERLDSKTFGSDFKDLMHVYKVFAFVCEVQYKDFFAQGLSMKVEE